MLIISKSPWTYFLSKGERMRSAQKHIYWWGYSFNWQKTILGSKDSHNFQVLQCLDWQAKVGLKTKNISRQFEEVTCRLHKLILTIEPPSHLFRCCTTIIPVFEYILPTQFEWAKRSPQKSSSGPSVKERHISVFF